jgi:cyclophilin family peptidyl-prolyl cis-trans isomerase
MPRFTARVTATRHRRPQRAAGAVVESLEGRQLLAAPTLAALPDVTLLSGAPLQIPLDGADADGDALTYTLTISNPAVSYLLPTTNRSLKLSVSHTSSGATDPAFTGDMVFQLFEDRAPRTTARIIQLAQSGFYNGVIFHRVIPNFVIQGGDPTGTGTGGSGVNFDDEFTPALQHTGSGLLSMAKSLDDTNDSQFFVTEGPQRHLDFNHSIFGRLVEGENIREQISNVPRNASDKPLGAVTITSATVFQDKQNRVLSLSAPNGYSGAADVMVTVSDGNGGTATRTFKASITPDMNNNHPFLGTIPDIQTRANTPVSFQIPATDVEGDPIAYLDWFGIYSNFVNPQEPPAPGENGRLLPPDGTRYGQDIDVLVDVNTGATTITPRNNVAGVFPIYLGVAYSRAAFDSQVVPLFVAPAAPTSVDLVAASDTGTSDTDNLTRLNNANPTKTLQFLVTGVLPGAQVQLFAGNTPIGTATVPAGQTSVTVTTNGTFTLPNGTSSITAVQTLKNYAWTAGNRSGTTDLASLASPSLNVSIDAAPPTIVGQPVFHYETVPQTLVYKFSEDVSASLSVEDVSVERPGMDSPPFHPASLLYDKPTNTATFSFNGVLGNGNYRAWIYEGDVTDPAGNPLASSSFDFWHLAGDANRDRSVDFNDLVTLAQNYNTSGKVWATGDFTADGSVDFNDLVQLAQNYNTTLAPPPPAAAAVLGSSSEQTASARAVFLASPVFRAAAPKPAARRPVARLR